MFPSCFGFCFNSILGLLGLVVSRPRVLFSLYKHPFWVADIQFINYNSEFKSFTLSPWCAPGFGPIEFFA